MSDHDEDDRTPSSSRRAFLTGAAALGAAAGVKLPYRAVPQVHGFWVPGDQLPAQRG